MFRLRPAETKDSEAAYEARRGSARERGYDSRWDAAARSYRWSHPLCVGCQAIGKPEPATLVDHIIPHRGDERLMWDRANWQSSCTPHHSIVKQALERLFDRGRAKVEDLRLDSAKAIEMTRELIP